MTDLDPTSDREVRRTIDRETALLESAIDLVASGGAPSATISGLRLAESVLAVIAPSAAARGVVLEPLWTADESGCDVRVSRVEQP